jgi:hypothetical protein
MSRKLTLRKEVLTVLGDTALAAVIGAQNTPLCVTDPCITPPPPTHNLLCQLTGDACA